MEINKTIVKIQDSHYKTKRGVTFKREMNVVRRKSEGLNLIDEYFYEPENELLRVKNFNEVIPGIYELTTCNESRCWETGVVDDWDYKLVPYEEETL